MGATRAFRGTAGGENVGGVASRGTPFAFIPLVLYSYVMEITFTLNEIDAVAIDILNHVAKANENKATVVGFSGDLGAGKTTLIQAIARILGVKEHVTSPTFVLQKNYHLQEQFFDMLVHIDAYRIESLDELRTLRFQELLTQPRTLVLIEWPERIYEALPKDARIFKLDIVDEDFRKITKN